MKVELISPKIPPAPMNFQFSMDLGKWSFSHIPLSLATVAASTPSDVEVSIVDENVEPVSYDTTANVVAFTGIYCQRKRLFELADAFKKRGKLVAIGGPIAADLEEECRKHADVVFTGECEQTWPRFFLDLARGKHEPVYRETDWVDLSNAKLPRFDLLKAERYSGGAVQATRGCPYRCEYCDVPIRYGNRSRSKPIENVIEEIRRLASFGWDSIFMVDDHFAGNRKYAKALLGEIASLQPTLPSPVYFVTQVTLNVASDTELLEAFRAANFRRFFLGIETSDIGKLRGMNKQHNTETPMRDAIETIHSHGITVWAGMMLGLDGDDGSSFDEQLRFIQESALTPTLIGLLQAMPGTPLFDRVKAEGRLLEIEQVAGSGATGALEDQGVTNLLPRDMDVPTLLNGFGNLVKRVYHPTAFGQRLLETARRMKRRPPIESYGTMFKPKGLALVARTLRWYVTHEDPATRRLIFDVLGAWAIGRAAALRELLYHLVIYKHLRTYYDLAAEQAFKAAREHAAGLERTSAAR